MGRQQFFRKQLETALTLTADFETEVTTITSYDTVTYSVYCTSVTSNTGTFGIQFRPHENAPWIDLTLDSIPVLADADQNFAISASQLGAGDVRLVFVGAGTDGVAEIWVSGKKVGA